MKITLNLFLVIIMLMYFWGIKCLLQFIITRNFDPESQCLVNERMLSMVIAMDIGQVLKAEIDCSKLDTITWEPWFPCFIIIQHQQFNILSLWNHYHIRFQEKCNFFKNVLAGDS